MAFSIGSYTHIAKYTRQNDSQFLESSWAANVKLHDRIPLVTREGTAVQIKEALARKPGATLRVEDMVDDSIVRELDKSGFIDGVYNRFVEQRSGDRKSKVRRAGRLAPFDRWPLVHDF